MSERAAMDVFDEMRSVERPKFFDGQQLFAADLDGIVAFNRAMRWLHNSSLHQPGIGSGLAVAGRRGDREVRIQPGYALDALGRELVRLETESEPVPSVASEADGGPVTYDLTVSYPSDDALEEVETREGVCLEGGAVRVRERPVVCWVRLARDPLGTLRPVDQADALAIQDAMKIVIARVEVLNCRLNADLSVSVRRSARPPERPKVTCGGCVAVEWRPWTAPDLDGPDGDPMPIGLRGRVNTSAAGFRATPCYTARICGTRPLRVQVAGGFESGGQTVLVLDAPAYVVDPMPDRFECFVSVIAVDDLLSEDILDAAALAARGPWGVTWLGIEA